MKPILTKLLILGTLVVTIFNPISIEKANALAILELEDLSVSGSLVTITDNLAGDLDPTVGVILFTGPVGSFGMNFAGGLTTPATGPADAPKLDMFNLTLSGGAGTLDVRFTDTGFPSLATGLSGFTTVIGGTTDGVITLDSYLDETNAPFGTATSLATLGPFGSSSSTLPVPFAGDGTKFIIPAVTPYSLTMIASVTHSSGSNMTSFDAGIAPVPEPASLILMGSGLAGMGLWGRKRKKAAQV